jgi:hypothetical protein
MALQRGSHAARSSGVLLLLKQFLMHSNRSIQHSALRSGVVGGSAGGWPLAVETAMTSPKAAAANRDKILCRVHNPSPLSSCCEHVILRAASMSSPPPVSDVTRRALSLTAMQAYPRL